MSNKKPRIYASCKAGCNWETIHRSEFESAYPYVPVHLNEDGILNIERNIRYKIYNKSAYTDKYGFSIKINVNGTIITINNPEFDKYQNYVFFKLLELVPNHLGSNKAAMIYELNGVRTAQVIDGDIDLVSYSVSFASSTGEVSGDGVDKFTFSKVETSGSETLKQVSLEVVGGLVKLTGDTQFIKDYEVTTGLDEETGEIIAADFLSIEWKTTCTPSEEDVNTGVTHTLVSGSEECWGSFAEAKYTLGLHYEIVDYSWDEVDDNAILSSTSVSGSTYTANYCLFNVYVENLERALICNDDVTFEVEYMHDDPTPIFTIYNYLTPSADLTTLDIQLTESQKAEILKDVEHTILKLTGASSRNIYFYYTGYKFGSYYYTTTIESKTYTMTIANNSVGQIIATISEVSGGTGGGVSEERVQEMIDNSIGGVLGGDY